MWTGLFVRVRILSVGRSIQPVGTLGGEIVLPQHLVQRKPTATEHRDECDDRY